jgi:hypothetical protein
MLAFSKTIFYVCVIQAKEMNQIVNSLLSVVSVVVVKRTVRQAIV